LRWAYLRLDADNALAPFMPELENGEPGKNAHAHRTASIMMNEEYQRLGLFTSAA
jgi:hypothetical protein